MIKVKVICTLIGEKFDPSRLTSLAFESVERTGEIGRYGRYKDKIIPFSSGVISLPDKLNVDELSYILDLLVKHLDLIRNSGVSSINLMVNIAHDGQCNWELTPEQIQMLSVLGIGISVSCYEGTL